MDHPGGKGRRRRVGLAMSAVLIGAVVALMAGWTWVAVPGALGILGLAAAAVGADTRRTGEWRRIETS